ADDGPPPPGNDLPPEIGSQGNEDAAFPIDISEEEAEALMEARSIPLPLIGTVNADDLGIFALTVVVGLVDGFNPCAMWVLLFLLSLLVNLKDRKKMFAIAGVFVLISGIAYFIFMAFWLEIYILLGFMRKIQIALGIMALVIGGIHIKDFFAFKKGVSLSIPDSAKSKINVHMRKIITAETLWAAVLGASVLAVMVNVLEMLCTLGLPTLYTNILESYGYPRWKDYAYIGLYNVAYMFDDSIMVIIAVVTLGKQRLEEKQGRWLKLVSGTVIAVIGLLMLFKPEWLGQSNPNKIEESTPAVSDSVDGK
ncbi:MAG: NrdH-redoxin, partial [Planctomycetaceae bacterium]|nr:NrdH-redoxin [Planctomycetaceae bacterium]